MPNPRPTRPPNGGLPPSVLTRWQRVGVLEGLAPRQPVGIAPGGWLGRSNAESARRVSASSAGTGLNWMTSAHPPHFLFPGLSTTRAKCQTTDLPCFATSPVPHTGHMHMHLHPRPLGMSRRFRQVPSECIPNGTLSMRPSSRCSADIHHRFSSRSLDR